LRNHAAILARFRFLNTEHGRGALARETRLSATLGAIHEDRLKGRACEADTTDLLEGQGLSCSMRPNSGVAPQPLDAAFSFS
jgi:hypothetical protein